MSRTKPNRYVKLSTLAELGQAFDLDRSHHHRPGPKDGRGKLDRRFARKTSSPPIVAARDCGLCGRPLVPGRYLCAAHVELALEAAGDYRAGRGLEGPGRVWITDNEQENHV